MCRQIWKNSINFRIEYQNQNKFGIYRHCGCMNSLKFWSTFHINRFTLLLVEFEDRKLWTREPEYLKQGRPHRTPHCFDGLEGWELLWESEPAQHSGIHHQSWRSEKHFSFWNTWYEIIGNISYKKYKFSRKH